MSNELRSKNERPPQRNCLLTPFRPVVTCTTLAEHEVVRAEKATERTRPNGVHGARLKIHQDSAGDILASANLVIVDRDPLELKIIVAFVKAIGFDPMLI